MKRFNITAVTTWTDKKSGETRKNFTRCGAAFINDTKTRGNVINLEFDFIPTAAAGKTLEIVCFEPKAKDDDDDGDVTE